ncbi:unnamed protein product [Schistosoma curassoni]|uniref:Dynein heavy chain AAA lid domain-containing protein n=1 Tax=Schistosoma curassoni TaxID=6186 RepID=A0A3P8EEM8_9TREM|nr:unnamed protein product [Schistosoma curassoni]
MNYFLSFVFLSFQNDVFRHLFLSLAFFHGVLIERKKFGPLGFNIPYEFTTGDLRICMDQLIMFLDEYDVTPYKVLCYTAGHINYGGRITDDWDRRCAMTILDEYYCPKILGDNYSYSASGIYHQLPGNTDHAVYLDYIRSLPINDPPEIFGLHENANITFAQNETFTLLGYLLLLQPKTFNTSGHGKQSEEIVEEISRSLLTTCPQLFDLSSIIQKYPVMYEQSMNTVLTQEVIRNTTLTSPILAFTSASDPPCSSIMLSRLNDYLCTSKELEAVENEAVCVPVEFSVVSVPTENFPYIARLCDIIYDDNRKLTKVCPGCLLLPELTITCTLYGTKSETVSVSTNSTGRFKILRGMTSKLAGPQSFDTDHLRRRSTIVTHNTLTMALKLVSVPILYLQ